VEGLLVDQVAVVTGGGRDLGRDIALALAEEGADVVIAGRTAETLERTAGDIRRLGRRCLPAVTDLCREEDVKALFHQTREAFGHVSVLVNNSAAERFVCAVEDMPLDQWERAIATKLTAAVLCCREALGSMIQRQQGSIVNISGTTGLKGSPYMSAHSVAQAGLIALTQALAGEVGKHGIRVNAVVPSAIAGESLVRQFNERWGASAGDEQLRVLTEASPLGRLVDARNVTDAVVFLASDRAAGMTGQTMNLLL
jgi:NAD(P)-dependent dehydrogenase (short-subunit alcohol dehydrogenase family)